MTYSVVFITQVFWSDLECSQFTPHLTQKSYTILGGGNQLPKNGSTWLTSENHQSRPMIEKFLQKNWRTVILIGVVLLVWFVWPTPYWYWLADDGNFFRQNRFNRCVEGYWYELAQWRSTSAESQAQAKIDTEEARKKANSPLPKEK